jgi:Zn-dependent M28 family amino/carboxypeptidase
MCLLLARSLPIVAAASPRDPGIPSVYFRAGVDYIGKPPQYGKETLGRYFANDYHQVTDTVRADWDLSGAAEQALFGFAVGWRLAEGRPFPQWKPGTEFKATRDAMLK